MNVLSCFDGISCAQIALNRSGIRYDNYYASEIKKTAINVTQYHYPNTIQLGDVRTVNPSFLPCIDWFFAGSPCKGISRLNQKQEGLEHIESVLFYEAIRLKDSLNPKYWLFENTHGNKKSTDTITEILGVKPISINSKLLTAQNRPRYYWTNIQGITQPKDRGLTSMTLANYFKQRPLGEELKQSRIKWLQTESGKRAVKKGYVKINPFPKYGCIVASGHKKWNENYLLVNGKYHHLDRFELEWLQSLPPGYTDILSYGDAYDVIGDGWTVDVICHILSFMNKPIYKQSTIFQ